LLTPLLFHVQCHGIREEFLEDHRGLFWRSQYLELILFRNRKEELQALDLVHDKAAFDGRHLHEVVEEDVEQDDYEDTQDCRY
jgi:hypothetical protein